ncbi:phosphate ABC transporter permease PstA [Natronosporangium hydrolyticum]|uniref:Phosphate transport system permease protein PstA n=1 Tax=Natronosporangium hydrolyticum TaxID=2811111 RepID=A0A895YIF5_9ACTN|nr:phosphate ABC transporter permease PstA [Natronosporangium hydrolyticum]QSB15143.1 phosphate ABC transporter permease PstA [Natronosporangium hydrolyticum]
MSTPTLTAASPPDPAAPTGRRSLRQIDPRTKRRAATSAAMKGLLTAVMAAACVPLLLILYVVAERGWHVINLHFFTQDTLPFRLEGGGFRQGFVGSFLIMALAIPMAVGFGIAAAVYLVEYGKGKKLAVLVRFVTDVMTGVPSIFVGLFVYAVLVIGTVRIGFGTLPAAVAIAIVMLPIVVRSSEEMLKLVPDHLRSASLGLGARRWQTTTKVVLPAAAPGLATGSMLAIARGAGETAPLILTGLGSFTMTVYLVGERQASLPQLIHQNAVQPFPPGIDRAWGGALCLVLITLLFTVVARTISARFSARREGM